MILPFIIHLPVFFLIAYIFRKKYASSPLIAFYWPGLWLKIISGIFIGLLYIYYYKSGDTIAYNNYSSILTNILFENPKEYRQILLHNNIPEQHRDLINISLQPRAFFFIKILSLINIFTFKNYWINSIYLSGFMFFSIYLLANSIIDIYKTSKISTAISFFFLPSFVFWTSGILKETFVIGSVAIFVYYFLNYLYLKKKIQLKELIFLFILLICSWEIKFYYLIVLFPVLISYFFTIKFECFFKKKYSKLSFFILAFLVLTFVGTLILPGISFEWLIQNIYDNYVTTLDISQRAGKVSYEFSDFKPEIGSFLLHAPKALIVGLFRPFIWESAFNFTLLVGLENLCILFFFFITIYYSIKEKLKLDIPLVALLTFISINAVFMAFISPNWGTLTRYKTIFIPFFVLLLLNGNPLLKNIEVYFNNLQSHFLKKST